MAIFRTQNDLLLHIWRLHREDKASQTEHTPDATPSVATAQPTTQENQFEFVELSLELGDMYAEFL